MIASGVHVAALFAPEHGIAGQEDRENLDDSTDKATGVKIWSLYKEKDRRPTRAMLGGIDALVFDIQDVGARFYTYLSTMENALEAAAAQHMPIYVLDRPNPITGTRVEGPILDIANKSFVGIFPLPIRHGMTIGELARLLNGENRIGADLHVIPMKNWNRGDWFDSTGLLWVDSSLNMRTLTAAVLYPGMAMLEYSKSLLGRAGNRRAFFLKWPALRFIHGRELAAY